MIHFLPKNICPLFILLLVFGIGGFKSAFATEQPTQSVSRYHSTLKEGQIGATEDKPIDNPVDNVFHVNLNGANLTGKEKVWLVYDLDGIEDHSGVSRSVNDQLSVGGYLVKTRQGWARQRERIDANWLRKGDNVVRFTLPKGAKHSYKIRNLSIEIDNSAEAKSYERLVVSEGGKANYYGNEGYIKGFVKGKNVESAKIKIDGKEAKLFKGEFEAISQKSKSAGKSWKVEIEASYADGFTQCTQVEFSIPVAADHIYELENGALHTEKVFTPAQKTSISLEGAVLSANAGALKAPALVSVTSLREVDFPALDQGMVNVTRNHDGFRFLPHGTQFAKEVSLRLAYDETKIPDGYTHEDIRTYYFEENSNHWVALPLDTVMELTAEVVSKTSHFTDMINAIIKVPESPEVEAYNSTSMKGIKAANPTAAVNLINPPQANNTGNASLGYPINIPAGRNGMQPSLSVSYNSGGGNGWMGLGWNITIPAISIDTRWGVPRFDAEKETETYSMNGEQLTPVAHRGELQPRSSGDKQFYPRVEGVFNKIIRHGSDPKKYWWEVTDKSGTKYFYGGTPLGGFEENATLNYTNGNVSYWGLVETKDLDGNSVKYQYKRVDNIGLAQGKVIGHQIYIDKIIYTDHASSSGKYEVNFIRYPNT